MKEQVRLKQGDVVEGGPLYLMTISFTNMVFQIAWLRNRRIS